MSKLSLSSLVGYSSKGKQEQQETSTTHHHEGKGIELLLQLNARLEQEVSRLCSELDEATQGVMKRGYLHKFRDRELSYASKWGLRYFVLKGKNLSYYVDDRDNRPRKTIDLTNCLIRPEGIKRGIYHLFSIYLITPDRPEQDGSRLLRLSCESSAEARQWMDMLEQACALGEIDMNAVEDNDEIPILNSSILKITRKDEKTLGDSKDDWGNTPIDTDETIEDIQDEDLNNVSSRVLTRVKSASKILKKSQSRQYMPLSSIPRSPSRKNMDGNFKPRTAFPASKVVHIRNVSSPLSTDVRPGEQNYRGFFNLGVIVLVLSNFRMITDNLMKYGFLMKFPWNTSSVQQCVSQTCPAGTWTSPKSFQAAISWAISILISYLIEKVAAADGLSEQTIMIVNTFICALNIILPCVWVLYYSKSHPGSCMIYLFQSVIIWMKLISYHHCNRDLRKTLKATRMKQSASHESLDSQAKPVLENIFAESDDLEPPYLYYPMNITLPNILYFCLAPTLCYQLNYPRSPHIRYKYLLTLVIRMFLVGGLLIFVVEQYIKPTLEGSIEAMDMMKTKFDISLVMEKLLKLSIPNTYAWLLMFYFYFHLWLNFLAEITRFGDRLFYKDWWNSRTIENYWRCWNVPVHNWMLRHLYHPLIRAGAPKMAGTLAVFFFSAVFHEYIISTPFRMYTMHVFIGMMAQAPLIFITKLIDKTFDNSFVGNAIFWSAFCVVGQPMGIILVNYDLFKWAKMSSS